MTKGCHMTPECHTHDSTKSQSLKYIVNDTWPRWTLSTWQARQAAAAVVRSRAPIPGTSRAVRCFALEHLSPVLLQLPLFPRACFMAPAISEYEKRRNKVIEDNAKVLQSMGLPTLASKTFKKPADMR